MDYIAIYVGESFLDIHPGWKRLLTGPENAEGNILFLFFLLSEVQHG